MREEAAFLKNGPKLTPVGWQKYPAIRIKKGGAIDDHTPALGPEQSRDDVEERGFARAGMPKQRDEAALGRECGIEREAAKLLEGADFDHVATCRLRPARRARNSDANRAAIEMTMDMTVSRSAPASPPGTCVSV